MRTQSFSSIPGDAKKLRITVDPLNVVRESNNDNNSVTFDLPLADITVDSASLDGNTLSYTLRNRGAVRYSGPLSAQFTWIRGNGSVMLPSRNQTGTVTLEPDAEVSRTYAFTVTPSYAARLRLTADPSNAIPESDNGNNVLTIDRPLPDLIVESLSLEGATVRFNIKNQGTGSYVGSVGSRIRQYSVSGTILSTRYDTVAVNLDGGESISRSVSFPSINPNTIMISVTADYGNTVFESSDENNAAELVIELPDLVPETATLNGASLEYAVRNIGIGSYGGSLRIRYRWQTPSGATAQTVFEDATIDIAGGGNVSRSFAFSSIPTAADRVQIALDPDNSIPELRNDNNSVTALSVAEVAQQPTEEEPESTPTPTEQEPPSETATTTPIAMPIEYIELVNEKSSYSANTVNFRVRNEGKKDFAGSLRIEYQWLVSTKSVVPIITETRELKIQAGAWTDLTYTFKETPSGALTLRITLDPLQTLNEQNRKNNIQEVAIPQIVSTPVIEPAPEQLPVSLPDLTPTSLSLGSTSLNYTISNTGKAAAKGTIQIQYAWLKSDNSIASSSYASTAISLYSGSSANHSFTFKTKPIDATKLRVSLDTGSAITESNESNNTVEIAITSTK